jgi:hypothetical protein
LIARSQWGIILNDLGGGLEVVGGVGEYLSTHPQALDGENFDRYPGSVVRAKGDSAAVVGALAPVKHGVHEDVRDESGYDQAQECPEHSKYKAGGGDASSLQLIGVARDAPATSPTKDDGRNAGGNQRRKEQPDEGGGAAYERRCCPAICPSGLRGGAAHLARDDRAGHYAKRRS